jgi:urease accessory protein UreF
MMRDGQDLHEKLSALGHGTASGITENAVQAVEIKDAASTDRQMHPQNTARGNAIRCLIDDLQDVANEFALLHVPPAVRFFTIDQAPL